jgi:hypothetical protein
MKLSKETHNLTGPLFTETTISWLWRQDRVNKKWLRLHNNGHLEKGTVRNPRKKQKDDNNISFTKINVKNLTASRACLVANLGSKFVKFWVLLL